MIRVKVIVAGADKRPLYWKKLWAVAYICKGVERLYEYLSISVTSVPPGASFALLHPPRPRRRDTANPQTALS